MNTLFLAVTLTLILSYELAGSRPAHSGKSPRKPVPKLGVSENAQVSAALRLIRTCPAWDEKTPSDLEAQKEILDCLQQLAAFETPVLRAALARIPGTKKDPTGGKEALRMWGTVFLLNRFIFAVPSGPVTNLRRYESFYRPEVARGDALWPLARDEQGTFSIQGEYPSYVGAPYRYVEEFDYYNRRFGRRRFQPSEPR